MTSVPEPLASAFVVAFGLVLGSFLNVCIHRMPRGESVVRPRSRCPACGTMIRWHDNVPLVSWLALRGRCGSCGTPISVRYPLVEALTALLLVGLWRMLGPHASFLVASFFALAMLVLFFTDWDHQLLPDAVTLTGLGVGLGISWVNPFLDGGGWERIWHALSGAALGSGVLWGLGAVYRRLRGVDAMGMGDVKMMGMVGAFCGPAGVLVTLFGASLAGAAVGLALIPLRGRRLTDALPFGCFLAPAALAALLYADSLWAAYWSGLLPPPP
jgi:leader peptidase (prepilin peptidase)/N-methyltransferase